MFSCRTCVLLMTLIILSKSRPNLTAALKNRRKFESFIVGGNYAEIIEFPHSAYIAISCLKNEKFENFSCGGSIINQIMLLSAAHCFEGCQAGSKVLVLVGNSNRHIKNKYLVESFTNHGEYSEVNLKHDIAMAMLKTPIVFSSTVKRIILTNVGIYNEPAIVAGWGITDEDERTKTKLLKYATQKVWKRKKCLTKLPHLNKGFICANAKMKDQDFGYAAVGDSGSALVVRGSIQIGLVSHKVSKVSKSLIVYTDVPLYYNWIIKTSKTLFCETEALF